MTQTTGDKERTARRLYAAMTQFAAAMLTLECEIADGNVGANGADLALAAMARQLDELRSLCRAALGG